MDRISLCGSVRNGRDFRAISHAQIECLIVPIDVKAEGLRMTTDEQGRFNGSIPSPRGRQYSAIHFRVTAPGYCALETRLNLNYAECANPLDFFLEEDSPFRLTIVDRAGISIAGAEITFFSPQNGEVYLKKTTSTRGMIDYRASDIPPLRQEAESLGLFVRAEGMCDLLHRQSVGRRKRLPDELQLSRARTISGIVIDEATAQRLNRVLVGLHFSQAITGKTVASLRGGAPLRTETGKDGLFELPYVEVGRGPSIDLFALADGYLLFEGPVDRACIERNEPIEVALTKIVWNGAVRFRAIAADREEPLCNTDLHTPYSTWVGRHRWTGRTDEAGFFSVPKSAQLFTPSLFITDDGEYIFRRHEMKSTRTGGHWRSEFEPIMVDDIAVTVIDECDRPVENANVYLVEKRFLQSVGSSYRSWARTDGKGFCTMPLRATQTQEYCLVVGHPAFVTYTSAPFEVAHEFADGPANAAVRPVTIGKECRLIGATLVQNVRVVDEAGLPQDKHLVIFESDQMSDRAVDRRVRTDARGLCEMRLRPFEKGWISVAGRPDTRTVVAYADLIAGKGITIVCPAAAAEEWLIRGIVTDEDGARLEGVRLWTATGRTTTGSDGSFEFCVERGKVYDLRIARITGQGDWWYEHRVVEGLGAGAFEKIVLKRTTGVEVRVDGFFDRSRGALTWNELWLEGRDGGRIVSQSTHTLGSRVLFAGVPVPTELRAVVRTEDGFLRASNFAAVERGKSRVITITE